MGSALVDIYAERRLLVTNTFFRHKLIHKYTWRVERTTYGKTVEHKALIDFVCVEDSLKGRVLDTRAVRGMGSGLPDHHVVLQKIRMKGRRQRREREQTEGEVTRVE